MLGVEDGTADGEAEGTEEGSDDGVEEGTPEGDSEGDSLGTDDGSDDGLYEGSIDGNAEGAGTEQPLIVWPVLTAPSVGGAVETQEKDELSHPSPINCHRGPRPADIITSPGAWLAAGPESTVKEMAVVMYCTRVPLPLLPW